MDMLAAALQKLRTRNGSKILCSGARGGELLGDLVDGCPAVKVERRPIVKAILRKLGYNEDYRRGTALQLLTRSQLLAEEITSEEVPAGQSADGAPFKLSAEEADAILSLAWLTDQAPSYAPSKSAVEDLHDPES